MNELNLNKILFDSNGRIKILHNIPKDRHTNKVYDSLYNQNHNSLFKNHYLLVSPAQLESIYYSFIIRSLFEEAVAYS
jgi:hypothetical protein